MKVRTKSALFTSFILVFMLLLGSIGRWSSDSGLARLDVFQGELRQDPVLITQLKLQVSTQNLAWKDILLAGSSAASRDTAWQRWEEEEARVVVLAETLAKSQRLDTDMKDLLTAFERAHRQIGKACRSVFESSSRSREQFRRLTDERVIETTRSAQHLLDQMQTRLTGEQALSLESFRGELHGERDIRNWIILGVMLLACLVLSGLGFYLHTRWITRPVQEAQEMARTIAGGRWTRDSIEIKGNDNLNDLLRCLNEMHLALETRTEELIEARDGARERNKANTEFFSRMSMQIRTPLVGVLGTTELLLSTDLEPDQRDFVETLALSSRHLVALVEDTMDFAEVDSGEFVIAEDEFDVRALFEDLVEPMVVQAHSKSLELGCMIERKVPARLIGDPRRIRHVANKLISNALKFTQRGGITISISLLEDGEKSCQLRVDVRDTGAGMNKKLSKQITAAFSQKDDLLMRKGGALGIGLSLAKRLANRMGGHLGFKTDEGKGSHFWFRLRLGKVEPKTVEIGHDEVGQLEGRRVLCLVDNEVGRTIFGGVMGTMKLQVDWVSNALQARLHLIQAIQKKSAYALILVDSQLPSQDLEFIEELRRDKGMGEQRILFMTQPLVTEDRERAQELGIDRILVKPCRESTLRETIQEEVMASHLGCAVGVDTKPYSAEILLVDDNTVNQRVGKRLLEKLGCTVDLAANGREGLEMSGEKDYEIILMDCHMPEMDGYQATMAIRERENEEGSRRCIIAMTADGIQGVRESCLASGMDDYAVKPIRLDQLHELLEKWLVAEPGKQKPPAEKTPVTAGTA